MINWTQTISGIAFDLDNPEPSMIDLHDIAHALAHQCRYAGHTRQFYSVAEHSVFVSRYVPPEDAAWALLHDAAEAYVTDLPQPVKRMLPDYAAIEERVMRIIAQRFGLSWPMPSSIKAADSRILMDERRNLLAPPPRPWALELEPLGILNMGVTPLYAKHAFLDRATELGL